MLENGLHFFEHGRKVQFFFTVSRKGKKTRLHILCCLASWSSAMAKRNATLWTLTTAKISKPRSDGRSGLETPMIYYHKSQRYCKLTTIMQSEDELEELERIRLHNKRWTRRRNPCWVFEWIAASSSWGVLVWGAGREREPPQIL